MPWGPVGRGGAPCRLPPAVSDPFGENRVVSLYWIIVAVLNLLLGLAAGVYLERWLEPGRSLPRFPRRRRRSPPPAAPVPPAPETQPEAPPEPEPEAAAQQVPAAVSPEGSAGEEKVAGTAELPPEIAERFQAASSPEELVLCAAAVLDEQSRDYLRGLAQLDSLTRRLQEQPDSQLEQVAEQLEQYSAQWLAAQRGALEQMTSHAAAAGTEQVEQLEHLLLDQAAQIETAANNLKMALSGDNAAEAAQRLQHEIKALVRRMHQLQEQTIRVACEVFDPQQHPAGQEQAWPDVFTGLPSRLGIAHLVDQWRIEDPHSMRQASMVLVGVDQMGQWNEQLGVEVGDWLLQCLAQAFPQAVRQNRGFDRVGYYGGDRFLIFLGDASPHNASVVAERMRQSVEEGQFVAPQMQVPLRVSCGVVECLPGDSFQATCTRAEETLQHAKQNGRNCTAVHDGSQVSVVQAPPLKILQWTFEFSKAQQPLAAAT